MAPTWDPDQYLRFATERERPFWDLVARIPTLGPRQVVDLGCGPGTATAGLLDHWPTATVRGIDSSPAMLEQAQDRARPPRLTFELGDLVTWQPEQESLDVVVSNAVLHWVPGHLELFARWLAALRPEGALAFQVPGNSSAPSHARLRELARSGPWKEKLATVGDAVEVPEPVRYHQRLRELGAAVDLWETTYYHVLSGPDPVVAWLRGSALRPYLAALDPEEAAGFTASYGEAMRAAYPPGPDGTTLLPFRRVFVVASRPRASQGARRSDRPSRDGTS
jgi:trans-aconitate 2-methyltransferase